MTIRPEKDHPSDNDGRGQRLDAIERDLERLGQLTGPHVIDVKEDLSLATGRIPDAVQRREAEEILGRLRSAIEPHLDAFEQTGPVPH